MKKLSWWSDPAFKIYICHLLSSWGDRMSNFATGLYLVILYDDSLILTALFGFSTCVSVIIFGVFIGKWIDKSERITIAKISIVVQNASVICSSTILILLVHFEKEMEDSWNGHLDDFIICLFILMAILGELGSVACKIALEKDWIVVLSDGEEKKLARMNTVMRTINLAAFILAPITVGQLLTYWSPIAGAGFVAGWNILSGICEFKLLNYIYKHFPRLGHKEFNEIEPQNNICTTITTTIPIPTISLTTIDSDKNQISSNNQDNSTIKNDEKIEQKPSSIADAISGWKGYYNHQVRNAGLGLASLYMSVLAFDNITNGHLYGQGLSESLISIITGIGAAFGIVGTLCFPVFRNKFGKLRTGLVGFGSLLGVMVICVISVFVDHSPFRAGAILDGDSWFSEIGFGNDNDTDIDEDRIEFGSISKLFNGSYTYELMLLSGLIMTRYGQWMSDLSVTQIFQEKIPESKRGIINGVQDSLNQFMNLLKYFVVICLPKSETFGYLIILTWIFTLIGFIFFANYSMKFRHPHSESKVDLFPENSELKVMNQQLPMNSRRSSNISNLSFKLPMQS